MSQDVSTADHNRQQEKKAVTRLLELLQEAQSSRDAVEVTLRVPVHGAKLGKPVGGVMTN